MLTNEQMNQLDMEVKQRGMGINPDVMPTQDEADNYAFTPEATVPETPMPEAYTPEPDNMAAKELINFTDSVIADVKKTNIWKRYTYGKEEVLREARDISIETGIPESAILYSPQTLDNARGVYNYRRKQMELMPPGSDEVSIDLLTKAYPGLEKIINNNSEVDAAIALQNIKNVRQVNGIVDAARTGWQGGMLQHEIANIGKKAFMEGRAVTDAEFAQYEKIQKQIEDLRQTPSFVEDPFLSIVGGTAQQVPQQLRGLGTGALYGTALAATAAGATVAVAPLTGGASMAAFGTAARAGWKWGMRLGYAVDMWQDSAGQRYIEYSRFKDKDGKRVLTDEEARAYAAAAAAVETGIEFMNAGKIMDVLKGNKSAAARQIQEAVAGATDNATFTAALKRVLSGMGEIAISESLEEGGQEASDRILSNFVASYKGGNIPKYTPGQVLQGAVESFAEALPASIGFGLSAAGGGSIGLVRRAAAYSELQDLHVRERLKNVTGINMIQNMIQDNGIKDFFKKDTDIAKDFLHNTVEGTGYEKVNIDTQLVLEQEGGMNALQDIAQAAGMSADEIQNAVETGADITVPTEVYFQMRAENENFAIGENFISFSDTAPCFARNQYYAKMVKSELDAVMRDVDARQMEQQQAALDMIVQGNFAEGLEQDAAAAILTIRPDNPAEGWKEMRGMYKQQLDDILAPVIKELKSGMKQGVNIVRVEGKRAHYERISNNAQWARQFYAENKRWPTQFELEGMAIDILSGRDFTKLLDFQNRPEMEPIYEDNAAKIDELLNTIEVFDGIRDKIAAIDADELQTMEGMSREAYDVYRNVAQQLAASAPNDAVKRSAKAGAALLARRADRYAEAMRAAGNTNYTAADYFRDRFGLRVGGTFQGGGSNTLFQVPAAEFNRQKAEVRAKYEGKDSWMKAPNGSDTNLTEDQWITVRTPAFKNWFGDWEEGYESSKVLDENGEPLVVKHWTMEDVDFDTFSREFLGDNTIDNASEPAVGATSLLGFWFNSGGDENLSSVYDRDMNLFLSIENPKEYASLAELAYFINIEDGADLTMEDYQRAAAELKEALQNEGYDGIVINDEEFGGKSFVAFEPNQIKDASGRNVGFDPASNNIYYQTSTQIAAKYPNWMDNQVVTDEDSKKGQTTQITGTVKTYEKVGNFIKSKLPKDAKILDASSGMGLGTLALRDMGIEVEDIEPYPGGDRMKTNPPTFYGVDAYEQARRNGQQYDYIISNAVLNVIPDDWRQSVLHDMASLLKVGGKMFINVRKKGEEKNIKNKIELDSPQEVLVGTPERIVSYQRFFTPKELADYVKSELGDAYEVAIANESNSGTKGLPAVVVTKKYNAPDAFYQRQQRQGETIQGATQFEDNGRRIISIFESGNESTMAHELGHIFVADLKELAEMPNAPEQIKKDWKTIKDWLGYKDSQKNFTTPQQEKFARGFEAYLRTGEAPATGLRKIFRQFKNWLTKIYKDFLSLGGKPSADVQAVMARMLATEQEVENAFKLREAENFEKVGGFDYLAKDSAEMYKRWQEEAQEYAKEKVLAQAMKDLTKQRSDELAALRDQMETDIRQQLQEKPLYRAQALLEQNPKLPEIWPAEALGMTYEEYTQAIAEQGPLDKAVKTAVDAAMQEVKQGLPMEKIKQAAEAAVNSSEYRGLYLTFEQDFMEKKQRRDETLNKKIEKILDELEKAAYESNIETIDPQGKIRASEPETDTPAKRKIRELKYQARWNEAEMKAINRMELAASMDELQAAVRDFKAIFKKTRQDVRVYRDTAVQKYKLIKQYAAENMAEMPISEATNMTKWAAMEKRAGRESIEAMKRAIDAELKYQPEEKGLVPTEPASEERLPAERKAKESPADLWRQANEAKLRQRVFAEYAAMAQKNKNYIRKKNARLQARSKTIAKNNNMPANERYMYNHGLYVLGLSKQDAPVPQDAMSLMEMIQGYKDNLQAFFVNEDGNISMPDYAVSAMTGNTAYNGGYQNLTMEQYQYFNDMLTTIYKAGIDANKVKSMKDINGNTVLISDVATAIVDETNARVPLIMTGDVTNAGTPTFAQSIQNKARRARVELTKPETILDMMGPTAYRYVYETVNQSWNKEQGMLEESAKVMQAIWAPYSNTEKSEMRAKKQYRFGTSILTKEQMICVAFNWGTEINRKRIMDGFGVDEMTVNELLSNLTQKDWQMVSAVWELVNSYWPETARVEESMTGIAPQKQTAMPFEITGKDGQVYKLQGGYYPIKYDPSKSLKAANQQQDDMAKQYAANNATMNRNRGFTKQRVQGTVARPVLLSFDVLNKHISDVVHNICFRESLRDVNRIIKSPEVSQTLQDHFGIDQTRALEQWVRDCWAPDVAKKDVFATGMEFFRHKQTAAALGYRMTTAMLNALNIYPMTDYLGAARTMDALGKFYSDPKANWDFCLSRSIFLRQRAQTMDRDAGEVLRKEFIGGYGTVADTLIRGERALEKHAFDALAVTDLMLANPLWMAEYQRVYQERTAELKGKMDAAAWSRIEMEAVAAGDKAVRKMFGSGEMKDLSPVQKGGEMTKAVTMFYSYFNVVFNALYSGYGEGRMQAMGTDSKIMLAPLAKKMLYWLVLTGVTEGLMRTAIDALVGDGGDDPEEWMKAMVKGVSDNIAGTIPVFRDIWSGVIDKLMGERYYGARPLPLYTVYDNIMKLSNTISSNKKSKIDVFREGARITNGMTGIGNAVTDAFATTAYWADTDFDAPLYQYLAAVFFDKRLDKKKK